MDDNTIVYDDGFKRLVFRGMTKNMNTMFVQLRFITHVNTSCWATADKGFPLESLNIMRTHELLHDELELNGDNKITIKEDGESYEGLALLCRFIHSERVRHHKPKKSKPVSDDSIFHLTSLFEDVTTLIEERKKGDD